MSSNTSIGMNLYFSLYSQPLQATKNTETRYNSLFNVQLIIHKIMNKKKTIGQQIQVLY